MAPCPLCDLSLFMECFFGARLRDWEIDAPLAEGAAGAAGSTEATSNVGAVCARAELSSRGKRIRRVGIN